MRTSVLRGLAILFILASVGCHPTTTPSPTERPTRTPTVRAATGWTTVGPTRAAPTPAPTEVPEPETAHRIGVRVVDGVGEFHDRRTGERFVPRGCNYIRLAPMSKTNPGLYERERAQAALRAMHAAGYNVVRIFVDCCREGNNAGDPKGGVSLPYLENVIDFLTRAKANEIYVLLVLDLTPAQGGYDEMWRHCCTTFDGENLRYLTPGGHTGERHFNRDFVRDLIAEGGPLEAIFAFDLTNEVHFNVDRPPFSLTTGKVTTANGKTCDMSKAEDKQRMMDENLVYWIDQQRANILEVDPTALVTVSFPAINVGRTTVNPGPPSGNQQPTSSTSTPTWDGG